MLRLLPLMLLAGCTTAHVTNPLPTPPAHLMTCAAHAKVALPDTKPTKAELEVLIAKLMFSESAAIECAEGWASWYAGLSQ